MSLEHAIKTLNKLDSYNEKAGTVAFYATADSTHPAVELCVYSGRLAAEMSACLPVNGWGPHAFAYQRAYEFLRLSGLSDSRGEQMGGR